MKNKRLGATGRYPSGKVNRNDEGELRFAIGPHVSGGVGIEFGKPVAWVVMPKATAIEMAMLLLKYAGASVKAAPPADHTEAPEPGPSA